MADAIPPMIIDIQLQTDQLKAQMSNLESRFNGLGNTVNKAQTPFKNFGNTIRTLLPAVGLAGLVVFTKQVIAAGEQSQKSDARLRQIATSMGIFGSGVQVVTERLGKYADTMARSTGVDDEIIKNTQAKLLTFRELALSADTAGGAFDRATAAAVDMAAAGFGEATNNAVQLGKALNDPIKGVTALTRSGITFTAAEKAKIATMVESGKMLDAQKFVLKAIETQVGGTAKATASATDRMKQAYGQVQEAIGLALLPMLEKFADWFTKVAPKIEEFFKQLNDPTTEAGKKWAAFTKQVEGAFKWILQNIDAIKNWAIAIGIATVAFKILNAVMNANPYVRVATGLALVIGGLVALGTEAYKAKVEYEKLNGVQTRFGGGILDKQRAAAKSTASGSFIASNYGAGAGTINGKIVSIGGSDKIASTVAPYAGYDGPGGSGGSSAAKARAAADAKFVKALRATQKAISDANNDYTKAVEAANNKYGTLIKKYADEMQGIIQTSMNRLKDAFRNAVEVNVGDIFKGLVDAGTATTDDLLGALKARLVSAKALADNAAALAGAGFSQTFIEQVVAEGPDLGNKLAETLKNATPESQRELQSLFQQTQILSNSGMDKLAQDLYDKTGLATDELKGLYDAANANMLQAQKDLAQALLDAATILNDSLTKIQDDFEKTLAAMAAAAKKHAKEIADTMAQISGGKKIASNAGATSGSSYTAYTTAELNAMNAREEQKFRNQFNITNNVQTNATPALIADTTVSAIKYGMPLSRLTA
jgi:hypothetical protein